MMKENKYKWTAIFLIKGVEAELSSFLLLIDGLLKIEKTREIGIVLCIHIKGELIPREFPRGITNPNGWTTLFYSLESEEEGGCALNLIEEDDEFDIKKQEDVSSFFTDKVLQNFTANDYILFTWDHGQPFGIFNDDTNNFTILNNNKSLLVHFKLWDLYLKELKQANNQNSQLDDFIDSDQLNILTITELRNAIQLAFGSKKISLIVMANCYLQFFDTGYELSACANYLIAFETYMYFRNGFNYKTILETLAYNPDIPVGSLAKITISTFVSENNIQDAVNVRATKNATALFANDLSWYPSMAKLVNELAEQLLTEMPRYFDKIKNAIEKCEYIPAGSGYCLVDFRNFVNCLYSEAPGIFKHNLFNLFAIIFEKIVVESFVGRNYQVQAGPMFISPSGFSIFLPRNFDDYASSFLFLFMQSSGVSPTEFVRAFRWEAFIAAYANRQRLERHGNKKFSKVLGQNKVV